MPSMDPGDSARRSRAICASITAIDFAASTLRGRGEGAGGGGELVIGAGDTETGAGGGVIDGAETTAFDGPGARCVTAREFVATGVVVATKVKLVRYERYSRKGGSHSFVHASHAAPANRAKQSRSPLPLNRFLAGFRTRYLA